MRNVPFGCISIQPSPKSTHVPLRQSSECLKRSNRETCQCNVVYWLFFNPPRLLPLLSPHCLYFSLAYTPTNRHTCTWVRIRTHNISDWLSHIKADPCFAGFPWLKTGHWGVGYMLSGTKSNICGVRSPSKTLLSGEAQREHRGSTDQLKARPFIKVQQMKEPKCLFLPPIPFSLPISPYLGFSLFSPHSPPRLLSVPFVQIQWE